MIVSAKSDQKHIDKFQIPAFKYFML